jgi:hypothetical protein
MPARTVWRYLAPVSALLLGACAPVPRGPSYPPATSVPRPAPRAVVPVASPPTARPVAVAATSGLSCQRLDDWVQEVGELKTVDNRPLKPDAALRQALLVEDERFVPIFGRPFDQMSPQELMTIRENTLEPCRRQNTPQLSDDLWTRILNIFRGGVREILVSRLNSSRAAHAEFDRMTAELLSLQPMPEGETRLSKMRGRAQQLMLIKPAPGPSAERFYSALAKAEASVADSRLKPDIEKSLSSASGPQDLSTLMSQQHTANTEAERFAALGVSTDWPQLRDRLDARVHEVAVTVAASETAKYRTFMQATGYGLPALEKTETHDRELYLAMPFAVRMRGASYNTARPEFDAFNQQRDDYFARILASRQQALKQQMPAILAKIARTSSPEELGALYADTVSRYEKDSEPGRVIAKAVDARFGQILPFGKVSGGIYLSMLYLKDRDGIHRADQEYLEGVRQPAGWEERMSVWAREMNPKTRGKPVQDAWSDTSMLEVVLSAYLYSYGTNYASCLRPGSQTIKISQRMPDLVTTVNGVEMTRSPGSESVTVVRVNQEFVPIFNYIYGHNSDMVGAFDLMAGNHKILDLMSGVDQMMHQFPCNDPKIRQLEQSMRELFDEKH